MKTIINKILSRPELQKQPPILIDIGASGSLHPKWRKIAEYSWCIAFDADQRDFQFVERSGERRSRSLRFPQRLGVKSSVRGVDGI